MRILFPLLLCFQIFALRASAEDIPCSILKEVPGGSVTKCGQLTVVTLKGDPLDRAKAQGLLLKDPLSREAIDYFANKIFDLTKKLPRPLAWLTEKFYNGLIRVLHRNAPPAMAEEMDAMSQAMGEDGIFLRRGISLPDIASIIHSIGSSSWFRFIPASGCTSVARNDNGNFFYGRNLDFAGARVWDKYPTATIILPREGSDELKHVAFGAHGVFLASITGVNEAGITFSVHQNFTSSGSVSGIPMFYIGEMLLRSAKNLNEAEAILRKYRPAVMWTFVVGDLKTGSIMAAESSPLSFTVRKMESGVFAQTNHLMGPKESEFISPSTKLNSIYRMKVALEHLGHLEAGKTQVGDLAKILSYQEDPQGHLSAYHDIIKAHTIQTILYSAIKNEAPAAFISIDQAPTAAGRFAKIPLAAFWDPKGIKSTQLLELHKVDPTVRERQKEISEAFHAYFDLHDHALAMSFLKNHSSLDAQIFNACNLMSLKQFEAAINLVDSAKSNPRFLSEPAYILQSLDWIKLVALHQLSRKNEAMNQALKILEASPLNSRLKELATEISQGRNPPGWMLGTNFDFFSGDLAVRSE